MTVRGFAAAFTVSALMPAAALAQAGDAIDAALDEDAHPILCPAGEAVLHDALLYRLADASELGLYDPDFVELMDERAAAGAPAGAERHVVFAHWLLLNGITLREELPEEKAIAVEGARNGLAGFVGLNAEQLREAGFSVEIRHMMTPQALTDFLQDETAVITAYLFPDASATDPEIEITCAPTDNDGVASPSDGNGEAGGRESNLIFSIRNKIDDLAVQRLSEDASATSDAFDDLDSAQFSFVDNDEEGTETLSVDGVVGIGLMPDDVSHVFAFLAYENETVRNDDSSKDDPGDDVNSLKPGVMWARPMRAAGPDVGVYGRFGMVAYPTFDFAQDSESFRIRSFFQNLSFNLPFDPPAICDRIIGVFSVLELHCEAAVFAELAHVFDAGTNTDFASLEDDEYLGAGGELGGTLTFAKEHPLAPFRLSASYRHLEIVSGAAEDPHMFKASFVYKIAEDTQLGAFDIGVHYEEGDNPDTFVDEEVLKISLGVKH